VKRVVVLGSSGAGKSTFADALARCTGLPVVHLDELYWKPGWVETPTDEWRAVQETAVADDEWIVDGNYSATIDVRLPRADTVILLDLGRVRCVARVVWRTVRHHGRSRTAAGCPDRFDGDFLRHFVWTYPTRSRPRVLAAVEEHRDHVAFVRLTSPRAVQTYLEAVGRASLADGDR
jgi:adenylate kinase family enzyme